MLSLKPTSPESPCFIEMHVKPKTYKSIFYKNFKPKTYNSMFYKNVEPKT